MNNWPPVLTRKQAAEYLGVGVKTVDRLRKRGRLRPVAHNGHLRAIRFGRAREVRPRGGGVTKASFDLKGDRAEEHSVEIKAALSAYAESHRYTVRRDPEFANSLRILNRLSNADRHRDLPVTGYGLRYSKGTFHLPDGRVVRTQPIPDSEGLKNGGELIGVAEGAVNVRVEGTAVVIIRVSQEPLRYFVLPDSLDRLLGSYRATVDLLRPYVRPREAPSKSVGQSA